MSKYKVGDRVQRTAVEAFGSIVAGELGTVIRLDNWVRVKWDNHAFEEGYGDVDRRIEPAPSAPPAQPAIVQRAIAHEQRAAAVKVCSSGCEEARRELESLRIRFRTMEMLVEKAYAERDALQQAVGNNERAGDIAAERDRYRRENHEQMTRIQWLERENARLTGKLRGRK